MDIQVKYSGLNYAIAGVGLVLIIYLISLKFQKKRGILFGNIELLKRISEGRVFGRKTALLFFRSLVVLLLILGLTDFRVLMKRIIVEGSSVFVVDVSSSMLTPDFVPNRLEVVKYALSDVIKELPEDAKIGIVSFSGKAYVEIPPTSDREVLLSTISNLSFREPAGTSISEGLIAAASLVNSSSDRIVLITDGKNNAGIPLNESLEAVKKSGARVNVIGIGTVEGISRIIEEFGGNFTINVSELPVLDRNELEFIANETNGTFMIVDSPENFTAVLEEMGFRREMRDIKVHKILLASALLILLLDWFLGLTKFSVLGE